MPRIVAGAAKGRRLVAPGSGTRPTSDRAREALFSSLTALLDLDGARVLDLFAGTGAVGLEALSRGAAAAVLVDCEQAAADALQRNVRAVDLPGAVIRRRSAAAYLSAGPSSAERGDGRFDLAFADPPYALTATELTPLLARLLDGWLEPDAVVVVERSARDAPLAWPEGIEAVRDRRYGEGTLWYGRRR